MSSNVLNEHENSLRCEEICFGDCFLVVKNYFKLVDFIFAFFPTYSF